MQGFNSCWYAAHALELALKSITMPEPKRHFKTCKAHWSHSAKPLYTHLPPLTLAGFYLLLQAKVLSHIIVININSIYYLYLRHITVTCSVLAEAQKEIRTFRSSFKVFFFFLCSDIKTWQQPLLFIKTFIILHVISVCAYAKIVK